MHRTGEQREGGRVGNEGIQLTLGKAGYVGDLIFFLVSHYPALLIVNNFTCHFCPVCGSN